MLFITENNIFGIKALFFFSFMLFIHGLNQGFDRLLFFPHIVLKIIIFKIKIGCSVLLVKCFKGQDFIILIRLLLVFMWNRKPGKELILLKVSLATQSSDESVKACLSYLIDLSIMDKSL